MIEKYLPKDFYWLGAKAQGKNLKNMFLGLSKEVNRVDDKGKEILDELDIRKTNKLLSEWENMLGIPGTFLDTLGTTFEKRKQLILIKLAALTAQTTQSFINIAALFGYNITVVSDMTDYYPGESKKSKFTFMIDFFGKSSPARFSLTFPIQFQDNIDGFLNFFKTLIPSNVQLLKFIECPYEYWENPVITENGEMGENRFAVTAGTDTLNAYKASDGDSTTYWRGYWILYYCPYLLVPQKIELTCNSMPTSYTLQGSIDNINFENITVENDFTINTPNSYKYFKFTSTESVDIIELKIKGVYLR